MGTFWKYVVRLEKLHSKDYRYLSKMITFWGRLSVAISFYLWPNEASVAYYQYFQ